MNRTYVASRHDREVGAPTSNLLDGIRCRLARGVDDMRGAHAAGVLELAGRDVDRDQRIGAGESPALHRVQSDTVTACPYKGRTVHYDLAVGGRAVRDIAWSYPFPIPECPKIENLICFYDERVDMIEVDGEAQAKPQTPWSR